MTGKEFFTTEEIAEKMKVKEATVRSWIKSGRLKALKIGREWRISEQAFDGFLEGLETFQK
jgi:excisionase family DNA binding protein